ncbi:MAG: Fe(2+)-trafficking protein [Phycisphaerales bacterium]|nr:Fe(2+)-trafficking protein [Phycisphaerales bacterium]
MDADTRIAQFTKLTQDDPTNDMAFFSLGNALQQAGRQREAGDAFSECFKLNAAMTKAAQLAGRAYIDAGEPHSARPVLLKGYEEAVTRGDLMPKDAIAGMLGEIDEPVPAIENKPASVDEGDGDFRCTKTGRMGTQLSRPPFRNGMGQWIYESISKETFDDWIRLGTKIINELRLDLSRDDHDAAYEYAMRIYLGLDDATYAKVMDGKSPPAVDGQFRTVIEDMMSRGGHLESFQGTLHERVE